MYFSGSAVALDECDKKQAVRDVTLYHCDLQACKITPAQATKG